MRRATFPVDGRLEFVGFGFVEDELDDGLDLLALLLPHRRIRRQLHRREHANIYLYITPTCNYIIHHASFQLPATTHSSRIHPPHSSRIHPPHSSRIHLPHSSRIRLPSLLRLPCDWLAAFGGSRAGGRHFVVGSVEGEQL